MDSAVPRRWLPEKKAGNEPVVWQEALSAAPDPRDPASTRGDPRHTEDPHGAAGERQHRGRHRNTQPNR